MERDRYQQNHLLFIIGMIALLIALSFMAFTAYVSPYLVFHWHYDIPDLIVRYQAWLIYTYQITDARARFYIFLFLFGQTVLFSFIAYLASNRIDDEIYGIEHHHHLKMVKLTEDFKESIRLFGKILSIIILIVLLALLIDWLLGL